MDLYRFRVAAALLFAAWCSLAAADPKLETVASGLAHPWALAFLPQGRFLVTERPGRMRIVSPDGKRGPALHGVPQVAARGQGGLLDVMLDSRFGSNRELYFCYAEPGEGGASGTALASAKLSADESRLDDVKVIFRQKPTVVSALQFGCRIVEARDGTLLLALGDRFSRRNDAQNLENDLGKIVRLHKDGSVPRDNPFTGRGGAAAPEIYSYGHRNPEGATLAPDGSYWEIEHGPQGGDEINLPQPGRNYGWPVITYGEEYGGGKIGEGTARAGMEQPVHYWVPSIAPSGMAFLSSERYGAAWRGNLFVGSLKFGFLDRIEVEGRKVVREHRIEVGQRVRDVRQGPDGLLYLLTDEDDGKLLRLAP
jgi:glucose/arabinose dehydrogenase